MGLEPAGMTAFLTVKEMGLKKRRQLLSAPVFCHPYWKETSVSFSATRNDSLFFPDNHLPDRFSSEGVQGKPLLKEQTRRVCDAQKTPNIDADSIRRRRR